MVFIEKSKEIEDNAIEKIEIIGGYPSNLIGIRKLIIGLKVEGSFEKLYGLHVVSKK
ncbi:MAG: TSCPD domain-containing protein [Erysipelotrichia bacterium]|nr:TSCPD domain-containing protein [Erysipelotrichia bacterium]